MKSQRVLLLLVLCATIISNANAQVQTPKYITTTANSGGYYEYLPSTYNSDARSYPLIIFVHGLGELGNGTSTDLPKLLNCWYALPRLINDGGFPKSFTIDGQQQGFIVISPQFKAWPSGSDVNDVINYAVNNYRVNQNRIYVTGLSMGGGATWDFASAYPTRAAAIVPVCGASWPDQGKAQAIATAKLPVWATHNDFDGTVPSSYTKDWITNITNDGGIGKKTIWPVNSHDAWTKTYDPTFKENNLNVYEWMLQYSKNTVVQSNMPPTANAGADQSITLPTNSISLNGAGNDADGSVTSYTWSQVSGGTASISTPSSASTTVGGLVQGSYVFRLTVTDNQGATASDDVTITVNPAPYSGPSYKIEAENWSAMSGVKTEPCSDAGGTLDVGWIDQNDWMEYTFSVPAAGAYTVNLRISTPYTGSKFQISNSSGVVLGTVNVPVTGGFQTWQTVPVTLNLIAGNQTIRLQSVSTTGWNINWLEILGGEAPNQAPKANAGVDKAVTLPANSVTLIGNGSDPDGTIASFSWSKMSGGNAVIESPNTASTTISGLEPGAYIFRLTVTDNKGASSWDEVNVMVSDIQTGSSSPTANDFESYKAYDGQYGYGLNPGWYGSNWSTQQIIDLGAGNTVKGIGGKAFRMQIYDNYLGWYGDSSLIGDYEHLKMLGSTETTVMIGGPRDANKWDTAFYTGTDSKAKVFKGLYEPIFINGEVNPNNTFAAYLYKVVKIYGKYIKFYEVWNEPDFTYGDGGWLGDSNPPNPNSWFFHDPTPEDLVNLRTPVQYYIRMLRISWEVIKKYQPNAYVCTGGIGNRSFLDALLRNSDNPNGGQVTSEFPLKGGAYFDILSFHTYPEFLLRNWAEAGEPASADGFYYYRHSDSAIAKHLMIKNRMDDLLHSYGYDASNYPAKQFICTETGMSRQSDASQFGGNEVQRNYMIKAHVKTQMDGQIKQTYWFSSADGANAATDHWDAFGCYYYFGDKQPYNATPTDQGIAMKTTSDLLFGRTYDAARTAALNLSTSIDGGAFKGKDGSYVYVLWAKTSTDLSESASGKISFPSAIIPSGNLVKKDWNFSKTDSSTIISSNNVTLTGTPAFFQESQAPAANQLPVVNAGADQSITLPKDSTLLSGTASDADGSIASYSWSQVSGPSTGSIAAPSEASTLVKGLKEGTYQFELKVTDNGGAVSKDTVAIVVKAAANQLPVVNAGADQSITLPKDSTLLSGTASDADGSIASYSWSQVSGPSTGSIAAPSEASTLVKGLKEGTYQFELKVTDNGGAVSKDTVAIVVKAAANQLPVVNAGADQSITLPKDSTLLSGTASDADGSIASYSWSQVSGPSTGSIAAPSEASSLVKGLTEGTYQFELKVTDNGGAVSKDTVAIVVKAAANQLPVVNAGADQSITLPKDSTLLSGTASDADGSIASYSWSQVSGPSTGSIAAPSEASSLVKGLTEGTYQFELKVTDNGGAVSKDTVAIVVKAAANQLPVVNAGADQNITLPKDSTLLSGTASDADGSIASYSWSQVSGPSTGSIAAPSEASTLVKGLTEGTYQFELKVTDNGGAVSKDTVAIVVKAAANQLPVVNAGADQNITLPVNNVTLNGSATDKDGTIASYSWTKLSGPSAYTITSPTTASTSVSGLVQGIYIFRLTVSDNKGATSSDDIQVTVNAATPVANKAPIANAGKDIIITLPLNKTQLAGSGTDSDGTIVAYKWTKVDGPVNYTLSAPTASKTSLTNLVEGIYLFQLTVTDNGGATGMDTVMVTVKADTRKKSTATLYPNPATSTLNVSIDAVTVKNYSYIRIYNSMGHIVYQEEFLRTQQQMVKTLDISSLDKGVYMMNINPDINTTLTMKFIKE